MKLTLFEKNTLQELISKEIEQYHERYLSGDFFITETDHEETIKFYRELKEKLNHMYDGY